MRLPSLKAAQSYVDDYGPTALKLGVYLRVSIKLAVNGEQPPRPSGQIKHVVGSQELILDVLIELCYYCIGEARQHRCKIRSTYD